MTTILPHCPGIEAAEMLFTPEPVQVEDVRVWRDDAGRVRIQIRSAGLGLTAALDPEQVDAVTGALLEVTPVPFVPTELVGTTPDLDDDWCHYAGESEGCPIHGVPNNGLRAGGGRR